jgi:hypothetical protein
MIDKEPSVRDMADLWELCVKFIEDNKISCEESVYLHDRVAENSFVFMHEVCKVVGFLDSEDEDDD